MIKLICIDLDGVLVSPVNFWLELHKAYGTLDEGVELTKQYLHTDYQKLVDEVVGRLWKGKDAALYWKLVDSIPFTPGIQEFFAELDKFKDVPRVIISGGCFDVAQRIASTYNIDIIFANQIDIKDHKISGEFRWAVGAGGDTKRVIIEQLCEDFDILPQHVLMIGDSESDVEAFRIAGVSIAFNSPSKVLKGIATYTVQSNSLHEVVPVLRLIRDGI